MADKNRNRKKQCPSSFSVIPFYTTTVKSEIPAEELSPQKPAAEKANKEFASNSNYKGKENGQTLRSQANSAQPPKAEQPTSPPPPVPQNTETSKIRNPASEPPAPPKEDWELNANLENDYVNPKIIKVGSSKQMMDFTASFALAVPHEYAQVHGTGGSGHGKNSTVRVTITDYSNGKGDGKSVTANFNVDVFHLSMLQSLGFVAVAGFLRDRPQIPNSNGATYVYARQKFNTYWKNDEGLSPASSIQISYVPSLRYPWVFQIYNCMAKEVKQNNGTSSYSKKDATDVKNVRFCMTEIDFCACMEQLRTTKSMWEMAVALPMVKRGYSQQARILALRENRKKSKQNRQKQGKGA